MIRPLADRVVVRPIEEDTKTASGLVLPDSAKEKPQKGEVLAVGPGRYDDQGNRIPLDVKVGDHILYKNYGPDEVKIGGEELLIIEEQYILAVRVEKGGKK